MLRDKGVNVTLQEFNEYWDMTDCIDCIESGILLGTIKENLIEQMKREAGNK